MELNLQEKNFLSFLSLGKLSFIGNMGQRLTCSYRTIKEEKKRRKL